MKEIVALGPQWAAARGVVLCDNNDLTPYPSLKQFRVSDKDVTQAYGDAMDYEDSTCPQEQQ